MNFIPLKRAAAFCGALFFALATAGCLNNRAPDSELNRDVSSSLDETRDYRIRPMDLLRVEMFREPEIRGELRVSGDGNLSLYLLDQVKVSGLTLSEAKAKLEAAYRDAGYYKDPQISLQIVQYAERRIYVDGYVGAPGPVLIPMEESLTLLRAITAARGLQPRASRTNVLLTRKVGDELKTWVIDFSKIQEGNMPDVPLQEGDTIYVQDSKI